MTQVLSEVTIAQLPYAVICLDLQGEIIEVNALTEQLTGFQSTEIVGQNIEQLIPKEVVADYILYRQNSFKLATGLASACAIQLVNKQRKVVPCNIKISENAQQILLFIEPHNQLNKAVDQPTNLYTQNLVGKIEEAFWEWDIEQDVIYYSAQVMALLGYEAKAYYGPTSFWESHVQQRDIDDIYQQLQQHFSGNQPCINPTYTLTTKQGEQKWVTLFGKVFEYQNGKPKKMFGSIKDVSESQKLINQLKKQNSYLHLAERLSNSGHWRLDLIKQKLHWSKGIYAIHGVNPKNYRPNLDTAIGYYLESERQRIRTLLEQAIDKKQGFHFRSTIINAKGKRVQVETLGEVELDDDNNVTGIFGVFKDITKNEQVIEKLKLLAKVHYTIKVPIFFIDDKDNIVYQDLSPQLGNKKAALFDYINFSINDYLKYKRQAYEKGQIKYANISFDKYITVFDLSITYEPKECIYIWTVENVTEKYRREQQQIISNRLALLGNTFGNVSHDINNVLGVALGATEMLELKVAQGNKDIGKYIDRVKNAIDKGKNVTERLLAFTRKPAVKIIAFDPIQEIKDNQYLFKQLLLNTIDFSLDFEDIACQIKFPQGEFINILLNLVLNAQDAIQEQGLIGQIVISLSLNSENMLEIHVKDSGVGIKQQDLAKIFDPFYSSKSVNKGNGIGLANVYSTTYKYNGEIRVEGHCELGGAEFILILPCKLIERKKKATPTRRSSMAIEEKSVLVLDDEVSIGEFVALYLESEGAATEYVSNKSSLQQVLNSDKVYDIFITDMILPDISGRDAVALVQEKFPDIKVYSISGYIAEEDNKWHYPVLRKPFNSKELAEFLTKH